MPRDAESFLQACLPLLFSWGCALSAGEPPAISPEAQALIDGHKQALAAWAADPVVCKAVQDQNCGGPLKGMTNEEWAKAKHDDSAVKELAGRSASVWLREKLEAAGGAYNEAFLNAAQGEKAAFARKTSSYIHAGQAKFDVPFKEGKVWQGASAFDESSQAQAVQVALPVLDGEKRAGVLVVGINLKNIQKKLDEKKTEADGKKE